MGANGRFDLKQIHQGGASGTVPVSDGATGLAMGVPPRPVQEVSPANLTPIPAAWANIAGAQLVLASAGTYRIDYSLRVVGQANMTLNNFDTQIRVFNTTGAVALAKSQGGAGIDAAAGLPAAVDVDLTIARHVYITVGAPTTLDLQAQEAGASAASLTLTDIQFSAEKKA